MRQLHMLLGMIMHLSTVMLSTALASGFWFSALVYMSGHGEPLDSGVRGSSPEPLLETAGSANQVGDLDISGLSSAADSILGGFVIWRIGEWGYENHNLCSS